MSSQEPEAELDDPQASGLPPIVGGLPRFPSSNPRPSRPAAGETPSSLPAEGSTPPLDSPPAEVPPSSSGPTTAERSSRASTDRPKEPVEEPIDPKDLQAAVTQTADILFVLFGQALGRAEARTRKLSAVDQKWTPTKKEREFVSEPAARIARRHVKAPAEAMDVIDGCLVAVGMGAFAMRGLTGVEPLGEEKQP